MRSVFQSPSLRGSGRFGTSPDPDGSGGVFQSPSLRGSGRFEVAAREAAEERAKVSIPFIAGQWSLRAGRGGGAEGSGAFQSPSLRGSGRFMAGKEGQEMEAIVSIPFIAGQWSLPAACAWRWHGRPGCFNPLHCGAVVASPTRSAMAHESCSSFNPLHCGAVVASYS